MGDYLAHLKNITLGHNLPILFVWPLHLCGALFFRIISVTPLSRLSAMIKLLTILTLIVNLDYSILQLAGITNFKSAIILFFAAPVQHLTTQGPSLSSFSVSCSSSYLLKRHFLKSSDSSNYETSHYACPSSLLPLQDSLPLLLISDPQLKDFIQSG